MIFEADCAKLEEARIRHEKVEADCRELIEWGRRLIAKASAIDPIQNGQLIDKTNEIIDEARDLIRT
jgi:hypothetical protein